MPPKALNDLLTPAERRLFARLDAPQKIQDWLDRLPVNFEPDGDTVMSPRRMLQARAAHCAEGALFAAAVMMFHRKSVWLVDLRARPTDHDHVVAVFRERGLWGAISKTNHSILRWRDPIYKSVRELAMSEIHLDPNSGMNEIPDSVANILGAGPRGAGYAEASAAALGGLAGGASPSFAGQGAAADPGLAPIDPKLLVGVSRNAPCPCGSGKKFKHCHGAF